MRVQKKKHTKQKHTKAKILFIKKICMRYQQKCESHLITFPQSSSFSASVSLFLRFSIRFFIVYSTEIAFQAFSHRILIPILVTCTLFFFFLPNSVRLENKNVRRHEKENLKCLSMI